LGSSGGVDDDAGGGRPWDAPGMAQGHYPVAWLELLRSTQFDSGQIGGLYGQGGQITLGVLGQHSTG